MKITKIKNDKAISFEKLSLGDTVLFANIPCMKVVRNGHFFLLDLESGMDMKIENDEAMVPIECELIYKIK